MGKFRIFVFANLKPSQIFYKIIPLSKSSKVEHVYILRKTSMKINEDKITCLILPWLLRKRPIYWFLTCFYGILCMRKYQANLILSYNIFPHGFNAYIASKITRIPAIFSEINEDTKNYYKHFIPRFIIKMILKNAKTICVPGQQTGDFWNSMGFNQTYSLHSTIDIDKFKPDLTQEKIFDYIYVGVFNDNKRPFLIVDAFNDIQKKRPSATLCIIGFGELENDLKNQINSLNLQKKVTLIKTMDVLDYYRKSKIFVMASLSEGLPCAMMEAMATELIVIVPSIGDIPDIIQHNINGYLYNNSKTELIRYMEDVYLNYLNLNNLRKNARQKIISNHSYRVATTKWNDLLQD